MDKKKDHKQDEYDFYREVMKKKPLDKRKILYLQRWSLISNRKKSSRE